MKNKHRTPNNAIYPPCQANCPVNTNVRAYVAAIGRGDNEESYRLITERNYFPSVCGRICPHPCEEECRRDCVDEAISIARLKRYVADHINKKSLFPGEPVSKTSGKRIAVIGSGPAGLTSAADLAKKGHDVVIYEKYAKPGGMLAYGVPNFRLDFEALNQDIARILNLGIELKLNANIGKDITFQSLVDEYDAVLISVGLSVSRSLPISGTDSTDVIETIPFLKSANESKPMKIGKKVVVIGGGDVAMDTARVALRTGAKDVSICCLECSEEMPAHSWEIKEALEEGISIYPSYGPQAIETDENNRVKAVDFVNCTSVFDEKGAFCPQFNKKDKKTIKADTVILAIGQASNLSFLKDTDVKINERGQLITNQETFQTSNPKVFGCGEVAKGPGAAINAIAHAHNVAESVNRFLNDEEAGFTPSSFEKLGKLPQEVGKRVYAWKRALPKMRKPSERINDFKVFEQVLTQKQALNEAHRCLSCMAGADVDSDKCAACLTCVRVCPYNVPIFKDNVAYIDDHGCQACGFCAADCPAEAIKLKVLSTKNLSARIAQASEGNKTLYISCEYAFDGKIEKYSADEAAIMVPCAGRIDFANLLKAFESGVKKVIIKCSDDVCRHHDGFEYIRRRVFYVNEKLKDLGFDDNPVVVERQK